MTSQEIEKCLEGLTPSERAKFESYLNERLAQSTIQQRARAIENGKRLFNFSVHSFDHVNYTVISYVVDEYNPKNLTVEKVVYTILYTDGKPKEIHRIM